MERGHRGPEKSVEITELMKHPELVFDSDFEGAQQQHHQLVSKIMRQGEIYREGSSAIFHSREISKTDSPRIEIAWPTTGDNVILLRLDSIGEERGHYTGKYGGAVCNKSGYRSEYEFQSGRDKNLEDLFAVPDDIHLIIKPTIDRWAIEAAPNPDTTADYGPKARVLYMGIGFLLLGREWMHIGMHEAGHLPNNRDENIAWSAANQAYAAVHKPLKKEIISGAQSGRFNLLKEPVSVSYGSTPTIGKIAKYGLVSHAQNEGAHIPKHWDAKATMDEFRQVIKAANEAYDYFVGR